MTVKEILLSQIDALPDGDVAVLLSGGVDSNSVLFALLEKKRNVKAYSFRMNDVVSTDYELAERNARTFGVPFEAIVLPNDTETLSRDLRTLAKLGCRKKTDFECVFPMLYAYSKIKEPIIASGVATDGYFCLSKRGLLHFKDNVDAFREEYFSNPNAGQRILRNRLAEMTGKILFDPYYDKRFTELFRGKSWDELNKPKQKMPIREAFAEQYSKAGNCLHSDLHKGDSKIADTFERLLFSPLNKRNCKSVVGIYNDIIREVKNERRG